jgi:hypothetical protein
MRGVTLHSSNTPSWRGAQFKESTETTLSKYSQQISMYEHFLLLSTAIISHVKVQCAQTQRPGGRNLERGKVRIAFDNITFTYN